jgi:hypothetical protein
MGRKFKGGQHRSPRFTGLLPFLPRARGRVGEGVEVGVYSCNCRFSDSTSSDSAVSLATKASILRTACSTVV